MTNLENSVIMPRDDFLELSSVAYDNHHVPSVGERTGNIIQTIAVFGAMSGAVVATSWGWAKAMDWLEEKKFQRTLKLQKDGKNVTR